MDATVPTDLSGVIAIAAGAEHSLALKADRTVVAWDRNSKGQLNVPHLLSDVVAISASHTHSVALQNEGVTEPRQAKTVAVIVGGKLVGISDNESGSGSGYPVPPVGLSPEVVA